MEIQTENGLKEVLKLLEEGNPIQAQVQIGSLFEKELGSMELTYTNRCCTFWIDTNKRLKVLTNEHEYADRLLSEWKSFQLFLNKEKFVYEPALYSVQKGFFSTALKNYQKLFDESEPLRKAEILRNAGICYKKLGNFDNARSCLSEANQVYPHMASVLAELADCYALCGEDKYSKVLFREAFFTSPEDIDLYYLDSELINCLIDNVKEKGYTGKSLLQWIPVYGVLLGIFNIKRELTSQEFVRLRQNIYAMENEYKDPSCKTDILVPKLLNSYFWLIDHYMLKHESIQKINEILLRIKILDSSIYDLYIK
ncbi:MAG: hypothetical protein IKX23_10050 [Treponema sp.]|nr:hypothetical protein [Treponema sp.]